jgi:hypothetical protein
MSSVTCGTPFVGGDFNAAIEALQPFVLTAQDGTRSIHAPTEVRASVSDKAYGVLSTSIDEGNKLTQAKTDAVEAFGGTSRVESHWWGLQIFLSQQDANVVEGGGAAAAILLGELGIGGPLGAIVGIAAAILWACTGDNGVIMYYTWNGTAWCSRQ